MGVLVVKQLCSAIGFFQLHRLGAVTPLRTDPSDGPFSLRRCQRDCLDACAQGARVVEMACGTGKTRVIKELAWNISGKVTWPGSKPSSPILWWSCKVWHVIIVYHHPLTLRYWSLFHHVLYWTSLRLTFLVFAKLGLVTTRKLIWKQRDL